MNICVVGAGYVGLTCAAVLASWGHVVSCVDRDIDKISSLEAGVVPIYEPGLAELVAENVKAGRLSFCRTLGAGIAGSEIVFMAVATPMSSNGAADLTYLLGAAREVSEGVRGGTVIVSKSTAPPGTAKRLESVFAACRFGCPVVVNPEFLREGSAVYDMLHPDRVVVGSRNPEAMECVAGLYAHLETEVLQMDPESAELIKYASNAFLATKISFSNAIARLCHASGADADAVLRGMGLDRRIGPDFLKPGLGYGGSCFPKDLAGLIHWSEEVGYDFRLLKAVQEVNRSQPHFVLEAIRQLLGTQEGQKRVTVLGFAFKRDTDDIRESPALALAGALHAEGYAVSGYDPAAMERVRAVAPYIELADDPMSACSGTHCVVVATDWGEFALLDLAALANVVNQKVLIDARNVFSPAKARAAGWEYWSVGRP